MNIKKVVVIGSGTMGSGIAAQIANAGIPVYLLDISNEISTKALDGIKKSRPPLLMNENCSTLIHVGNIEDDMDHINDADWIVEAVPISKPLETDAGNCGVRTYSFWRTWHFHLFRLYPTLLPVLFIYFHYLLLFCSSSIYQIISNLSCDDDRLPIYTLLEKLVMDPPHVRFCLSLCGTQMQRQVPGCVT
mgnify:CR=1 FL=1